MPNTPPLKNSPSDEYVRGAADCLARCISRMASTPCLPLILDVADDLGLSKDRLKSSGVEQETIATISDAYTGI